MPTDSTQAAITDRVTRFSFTGACGRDKSRPYSVFFHSSFSSSAVLPVICFHISSL